MVVRSEGAYRQRSDNRVLETRIPRRMMMTAIVTIFIPTRDTEGRREVLDVPFISFLGTVVIGAHPQVSWPGLLCVTSIRNCPLERFVSVVLVDKFKISTLS
jgi:hypothetical protein